MRRFLHMQSYFYDHLIGDDSDGADDKILRLVMKYFGGQDYNIPVDRTGTFKTKIPSIIHKPLPDFAPPQKSVKEIFLDRARETLNKNQPVDILWSGGVDSTALLCAFLNVCEDLSRVRVVTQRRSINEYPLFFEKFIKREMHYIVEDTYIYHHFDPTDRIVVTGHHAGMLCGQHYMLGVGDPHAPWRDIFASDKPLLETQSQDEYFVEHIQPLLDVCPFKVESYAQLFWWIMFATKWQVECFDPCWYFKNFSKDTFQNFVTFYSSDDFQSWAVDRAKNNKETFANKNLYKSEFKDVIYEMTHDEEYHENKQKIKSGSPKLSDDKNIGYPLIYAIDENYIAYSREEWTRW